VAPGARLRTATQTEWDTPLMGLTGGLTKAPRAVADWWKRHVPSFGFGKSDAP
jgi:hypothetical protein